MAKKGSHYIKQKADKPLFTKKDIKWIIGLAAAIIAVIAAFFIMVNAADESLKIKDGKVIGAGENWIIANSGAGETPTYFKYAEFDFHHGAQAGKRQAVAGELRGSDKGRVQAIRIRERRLCDKALQGDLRHYARKLAKGTTRRNGWHRVVNAKAERTARTVDGHLRCRCDVPS